MNSKLLISLFLFLCYFSLMVQAESIVSLISDRLITIDPQSGSTKYLSKPIIGYDKVISNTLTCDSNNGIMYIVAKRQDQHYLLSFNTNGTERYTAFPFTSQSSSSLKLLDVGHLFVTNDGNVLMEGELGNTTIVEYSLVLLNPKARSYKTLDYIPRNIVFLTVRAGYSPKDNYYFRQYLFFTMHGIGSDIFTLNLVDGKFKHEQGSVHGYQKLFAPLVYDPLNDDFLATGKAEGEDGLYLYRYNPLTSVGEKVMSLKTMGISSSTAVSVKSGMFYFLDLSMRVVTMNFRENKSISAIQTFLNQPSFGTYPLIVIP
ncbi:hypothetical protein ABK040_005294 [Willaertia magna]